MNAVSRTIWPDVPLSELAIVTTGSTPKTDNADNWGGAIPFVTPGELGTTDPIVRAPRTLSNEGVHRSRVVPAGSTLVCCIGSLGKTGIAGSNLVVNQQINAVTFDPKRVDARFGFYACKRLAPELQKIAPATTVPIVNKSLFSKLCIPLPPLDEQRRIAAILDKADALRQKRKRSIALLDSLTQSIFLEMFGLVETNDRGWDDTLRLADLADVGSGITKGRPDKGQATREIAYMAVANVQDKHLSLEAVKTIHATDAEIDRYRLRRDDLLLTEGGDPDKLGRGTLWRDELPEAIHQNHIFKVRFVDERVIPLFANWLIGSQRGKRYFLQSAKQTTGIASINKTQLSNFPMLLPPVELQRAFAVAATEVQRRVDTSKGAALGADSLFASLQHRAFSGQL